MPATALTAFEAALASALATTVIAIAAEWLKQRGRQAQVKRDLARSADRLTFLSEWLTMHERLPEFESAADRLFVSHQLERLRRDTQHAWDRPLALSPARTAIQSLLLLNLRRKVWSVQLIRGLYWLALVNTTLVLVPALVARLIHLPTGEPVSFQFGYVVGVFAHLLPVPIAVLFVLRWILRTLDRRRQQVPSGQLGAAGSAPIANASSE